MAWQPMETAPRDGTQILVYTIHGTIELTEWYQLNHYKYIDVGDGLYRKENEVYHEGWNSNIPAAWQPLPVVTEHVIALAETVKLELRAAQGQQQGNGPQGEG